jgi:hypothetical protein
MTHKRQRVELLESDYDKISRRITEESDSLSKANLSLELASKKVDMIAAKIDLLNEKLLIEEEEGGDILNDKMRIFTEEKNLELANLEKQMADAKLNGLQASDGSVRLYWENQQITVNNKMNNIKDHLPVYISLKREELEKEMNSK